MLDNAGLGGDPVPGRTINGQKAGEAVRRARVWLSRAVEPGSAAVYRFVGDVGPVEAVRRLRAGTAPPDVDRAAAGRRELNQVDDDLAKADRCGARVLVPEDDEWPAYTLLRMESATGSGIPDLAPPLMLWVRGNCRLDILVERAVAIVGSRAATDYGVTMAKQIAFQLATRDWAVVSGGALGIDAAAHRGCLAAGGPTVAVVAGGLDSPYPRRNEELFERIVENGLLLSEWPPGCAPQRHRFLLRNRLIAGLVAGTVVVQAGARSGATNTARRTGELGAPVMALPGPVTSALSVGCHQLVRTGLATLVTNTEEIVEEIGRLGEGLNDFPREGETILDRLDPLTRRVLDGVPARGTAGPDEIAMAAGVEMRTAMQCLPALELLGFVRHEYGAWRLVRTPPRSSAPG